MTDVPDAAVEQWRAITDAEPTDIERDVVTVAAGVAGGRVVRGNLLAFLLAFFLTAILALAVILISRADADRRGWEREPAPWSEDQLLSRCVHRGEGNYVIWLYNVPSGSNVSTSDVSMFVVPLPEGRPCSR